MKCLIHIGTEKTGTTHLQNWLYTNREYLGSRGVYLSENFETPNNRRLVAYCQNRLDEWTRLHGISSLDQKAAHFSEFASAFSNEVTSAAESHHTFLITSEHFHSRLRTKEEIERLFTLIAPVMDEIVIVGYFREQADMARSFYSTAVKRKVTQRFDAFLEGVRPASYYYNFSAIADNWSSVFGVERCRFRIYDRDRLVNGDIRHDFVATTQIAVNIDDMQPGPPAINDALSHAQVELFRIINEEIPFWLPENGGVNPENRRMKQLLLGIEPLQQGRLYSPLLEAIPERFSEVNKAFFSKYLPDEPVFSPVQADKRSLSANSELLAESLGALLRVLLKDTHSRVLLNTDADTLRDIALGYDTEATLSLHQARYLMGLAHKARPEGPFIAKKFAEYSVEPPEPDEAGAAESASEESAALEVDVPRGEASEVNDSEIDDSEIDRFEIHDSATDASEKHDKEGPDSVSAH